MLLSPFSSLFIADDDVASDATKCRLARDYDVLYSPVAEPHLFLPDSRYMRLDHVTDDDVV
jgi:hypothetical protein